MPFSKGFCPQKERRKNNILRVSSLFVTRVCDTIASHKNCELSVDRMGRKRYNTSCVSVKSRAFMSTAVREGNLTRRRVSAAAGRPLPVKFFQEVKRNGYFSHLSAQEDPALQGARLPQENVHCQRPQGSCPSSCTRPRPSHPLRAGATCVSYATDETMRDGR